jgi:hypothetical protein
LSLTIARVDLQICSQFGSGGAAEDEAWRGQEEEHELCHAGALIVGVVVVAAVDDM